MVSVQHAHVQSFWASCAQIYPGTRHVCAVALLQNYLQYYNASADVGWWASAAETPAAVTRHPVWA